MKRSPVSPVALLVSAVSLGSASAARSGDGLEFTLAGGWLRPKPDVGTYTHSYVPRVDFDASSGGTAGHTLTLDREAGFGIRGALGFALGPRLGLDLFVASASADLSGTSTPYALQLGYTARQPPSYEPRPFVLDSETEWPPPEGRLRQTILGLSLRVRLATGRHYSLGVSAGPALHRVSADLEPLAFTHSWFGGHAVLFQETFQLAVDLPAQWRLGLDLGGELALRLGPQISLLLDVRYSLSRGAALDPAIAGITNLDELLQPLPLSELAAQVPLAPLEIDPSFAAAFLGLRVRL